MPFDFDTLNDGCSSGFSWTLSCVHYNNGYIEKEISTIMNGQNAWEKSCRLTQFSNMYYKIQTTEYEKNRNE